MKITLKEALQAIRESDSFKDACSFLEDKGWMLLGKGANALVYGHDDVPDQVIKISDSCTDGWLKYAEICQSMTDPHALRVDTIEYRVPENNEYDNFYFAVIEKLEELEQLGEWTVFDILSNFYSEPETISVKTSAFKTFSTFIARLGALFPPGNYYWDLHENNVMVRDDGTLVVTDPIQ